MATENAVLRVGGVPEHFNLPMHDTETFAQHNLTVNFQALRGGTGEMVDALLNDKIDVALGLTDGLVKASCAGKGVRLCGVWVSSPLVWALAAKKDVSEPLQMTTEGMRSKAFGVSRMGSGSHTMAYLLCKQLGLPVDSLQLKIASNIDGLTKGTVGEQFDCFLWETHMMEPYFIPQDDGTQPALFRAGEIPTPWPAFCLAVNTATLTDEKAEAIRSKLLPALTVAASRFKENKGTAVQKVVESYGLKEPNAEHWFDNVEYPSADNHELQREMLGAVMDSLFGMGLIEKKTPLASLIDGRIACLTGNQLS